MEIGITWYILTLDYAQVIFEQFLSQGWRCGNSADRGLKPFLTAGPGGQGGMRALA